MKLTTEQQSAIENAERDMVITAAAGAGKTFVLTEIVAQLIEEQGISPQQLVVITFTEKAAQELKERLARRVGETPAFFDDCPIGTIHAFAAGVLREHSPAALRDFVIWEGHRASLEASRLVHEELRRLLASPSAGLAALFEEYGWRVLVSLMSQLLSMRWKMRALSKRSVSEPLWQEVVNLHEQLKSQYVKHKRRHGAYDFEDLEEKVLSLLSQQEEKRRLQDRFRHIVVDEYQDISPPQYEMIRQLHRLGTNRLIIVGDPLQSIYRFRGAEVVLFSRTQAHLQEVGAAEVELRTNFRSSQALIGEFNRIFQSVFSSNYQPMQGIKDGDNKAPLELIALPKTPSLSERRQVEAKQVVRRIKDLMQTGYKASDIAVLFRSRAAMSDYEDALQEAELPVCSQSGNLLLEQPEILDQLNALRALCRPEDHIALGGLMVSPLGGLPDRVLWACRGRALKQCLRLDLPELSPSERKKWNDFVEWWAKLSGEVPYLKASEIAERLLQRGLHQQSYGGGRERANLRQWIEFLRWMEQIDPFELDDLLSVIEGFREDGARIYEVDHQGRSEGGVCLMTVHGAKGLEFPVVVLADLSASIPTSRDPILIDAEVGVGMRRLDEESRGLRDQMLDTEAYRQVKEQMRVRELEESRRLLYVACTRAQDLLILPLDRHRREKQPTWNKWLCEALYNE